MLNVKHDGFNTSLNIRICCYFDTSKLIKVSEVFKLNYKCSQRDETAPQMESPKHKHDKTN